MSGTTSVPRPVWDNTGFIAPAESAVLAGVNADMSAAFGGNLNTGTTDGGITNATPQGQLAASLTAIVGDKNSVFLRYTQQVDPAYADGRMQDGIARIYFISRNPSQPTVVTATCTGLQGVIIPAGATAKATDGTLYVCTTGGQIPVGGSVSLQFASAINGPFACPAHSLSAIYQSIPGWDSIDNPLDGVLGQNTETRAAFEARRGLSVAKNSVGQLTSILGAVLNVPGVLDGYVTENTTSGAVTIGGVSVAANSIYVAAIGGTDADVAHAIWTKKAPGCGYTGTTTVTVVDSNSGYLQPLPTYAVKFTRPTPTTITFKVQITNSLSVPSTALAQIQAAIISSFAGADGGRRARIGSTIYGSRFYGGVVALGAWAQIIEIEVGTGGPGGSFSDLVTMNINQAPVVSAADILLTLV